MSSHVAVFQFHHGLGDSVNFAHAVRLWVDKGYEVQVSCPEDKEELFRAAGAKVGKSLGRMHPYLHPPATQIGMLDDWSENKVGHNLQIQPLPNIGCAAELWPELLNVKLQLPEPNPQTRKTLDKYLASLPGKPILLHTRANTSPHDKNLTEAQEKALYRALINRTENPLLLLDWDSRAARYTHYRCRHLLDDFQSLNLVELAYVMERSALVIGVDSGPLHFARLTSCPALGIWFGHHPARFAIPRDKTLHLTEEGKHGVWNAKRRHSFNICDVPKLNPETIAYYARNLVDGVAVTDLVFTNVLEKVNTWDGNLFHDRTNTMGAALRHLATKKAPRIVETGCARQAEDWTAGFSTYIFGMFLQFKGAGRLDSVDINRNHCALAREWTAPFIDHVTVHEGDSVAFLDGYKGTADLVFLDSWDIYVAGFAEHGLAEARKAVNLVAPDGMILFDDTWHIGRGKWKGKGEIAVPWLLANGWKVHPASGYQCLLVRKEASVS